MWIGNLEELKNCLILSNEAKESIINFIINNDMGSLSNGRHEIGNNNYINVFEYETKDNDGVFELHHEYIDIHYAIHGEESVLYADNYDKETKEYQIDGDYSLGVVSNPNKVILGGEFCIFLPNEPHNAGIIAKQKCKVKKAVFKIKQDKGE